MLAHSSLNVTERYMGEFDTAAEDQALENIFQQEPASISKEVIISALKGMSKGEVTELLKSLK